MRIRLQTRTTLTIALLVVLVLTASSLLFYDAAKRALDAEMGERLVAVARTSAAQLDGFYGSYLSVLQPGDEGMNLYPTLQGKLQSMRDASEARAMYVFDLEYKSLVDSRLDVPIGRQYRSLGEDGIHIDQAKRGTGAASVAFHGKDGAFYRSAYAPIRDEHDDIVAILAVDASVLFLESLAAMSRKMVLIGAAGMVLAIVLSVLLARSIVVPIERLSQATQRIKAGAFGTQVETGSEDEVGLLATTFNEMSSAIQKRDQEVSRMAEELRQLSAGLAHEVRNPLNGMRIFLGLLRRQIPADPKAEQLIEQVDGEVQSLNQLVTEFLDFARPTPLQTEPVDLSDVVASVLALLDGELRADAIQVQTAGLDTLPSIEADADRLKWVFTNLIKNAAQAIEGGGTISIEGSVDADAGAIRVEVRDTGAGMSPETVARAFNPFFTTKDKGTGLGLAIVNRLIEHHRGTIECASEEGGGTTFVLRLPVAMEAEGRR